MTIRHCCAVVLLLLGAVCPAAAQAIDRPPRANGGLFAQRRAVDPNAPVQELTAMLDIFGGYDDNVTAGIAGDDSLVPRRSTSVGRVEAELRFRKARRAKSLEATGRGFFNYASLDSSQFVGGEAALNGATDFGRRSGGTISFSAANEPAFLFNAFGPLAGQMDGQPVSDGAPAQGITNQRWLMWRGSVGLYRNFSTRHRTDVQFIRNQRRPSSGAGLESQAQAVLARHEWRLRNRLSLQASYHFDENNQSDQAGANRPLRSQTGDLGLRYSRLLSQGRRVTAGAGGGATFVRAFTTDTDERRDFVVPTAYGLTRLDLGRTWGLQADVRRDITVLQGVSPEPFAANALSFRLDGIFSERFQFGTSAAYSQGGALVTNTGEFEAAGATAQVQFILARYASVFTTYRYYRYELTDLASIPAGFPGQYTRNSIQLGVTLWLPVLGRF